jgi:hypothetical protein
MKKLFLIATAVATICGTAGEKASACDLRVPIFELAGFPISSHQVALLGGAGVVERLAAPTRLLAGMPASPHQIAVLTPRPKAAKLLQASADPAPVTVGIAPSPFRSASVAGRVMCVPE